MNHTTNYQLNQWEKTDRIQMEDFNADNEKTDQALAALATSVASRGNCEIATTTYTGNNTNSRTLTFSKPPLLVAVCGGGCALVMTQGCNRIFGTNGNVTTAVNTTWSGSSVTWTPGIQGAYAGMCNTSGQVYHVTALFQA